MLAGSSELRHPAGPPLVSLLCPLWGSVCASAGDEDEVEIERQTGRQWVWGLNRLRWLLKQGKEPLSTATQEQHVSDEKIHLQQGE